MASNMNRSRRLVNGMAMLVVLLAALPLQMVHAQEQQPVKIRVPITDVGFNDQSDDFTIEVDEGALVELTFVWAHKAYPREEHIIVVDGYKLESDKLNADHKEVTLKFTADKPGTFGFRCDIECELHDHLQKGNLKVKAHGSGGAAASFTPTTLSLTPSTWATGGDPVNLTAVLRDTKGTAVPKAEIIFTVAAQFVGTKGEMEIGRARTDANGVAFLDYRPTLAMKTYKITAHFDQMGIYAQSQNSIEIEEVGVPPAAYTVAPIGLESISQLAPYLLAVVVVGVWLVLGFVFYQGISIARLGKKK